MTPSRTRSLSDSEFATLRVRLARRRALPPGQRRRPRGRLRLGESVPLAQPGVPVTVRQGGSARFQINRPGGDVTSSRAKMLRSKFLLCGFQRVKQLHLVERFRSMNPDFTASRFSGTALVWRSFSSLPSVPDEAVNKTKGLHAALRAELMKEMQHQGNPRQLIPGWDVVPVDKFYGGENSIVFLSRHFQNEQISLISSIEVKFSSSTQDFDCCSPALSAGHAKP